MWHTTKKENINEKAAHTMKGTEPPQRLIDRNLGFYQG
jgi:hypothetical protein